MNITVVPGRRLAPEHIKAWSEAQEADSALASPFLRPEFTLAVAGVRDDVNVGVLEQGGQAVGFFPYQRGRFSIGHPVGGPLNDLQGVIVRPGIDWDGVQLIRGCGLLEWKYGRLLASQLKPFHLRRHSSAFIDLSRGYDAYVAEKRRAGINPENILRLARKTRKLERDVGPLRFELHSSDATHLATLMKWKFERYAAHGYDDVFGIPWARQLVERLHATQTASFGGTLSVLYAGDEVAAAHMGIRSQSVWHYWFPAYNRKFAPYSPGLMLLLRMAQHALTAGLRSIELGGGDYEYKQTLMNHSIVLAEGTVDRLPLIATARRWRLSSENAIRQSPFLRPPARTVVRAIRGVRHLFE